MPTIIQDGTTKYVTGPGGLPLEQVSPGGTVRYYYQDQLGSTRALRDATGTAAGTCTYNAYGNLKSSTGSVSNPFQYAGQYTDSESGLQYLRARYYDPSTQQFLTVDPIAAQTGQPYVYAGSNPVSDTDPMGLSPKGGSGGCQCRQSSKGFRQWLSNNWAYVTLLTGVVAMIGVALGPAAAVVLGGAAFVASVIQIYLDVQKGDSTAVAGDTVGTLLGVIGIGLGWRALRLMWELKSLVGLMAESVASGNFLGVIMILARALGVNGIKQAMDRASIKYVVNSVAFSVWAAVGTGEAACR